MPMDPLVQKFERHLRERLSLEELSRIDQLTGIEPGRWQFLLGGAQRSYNRLNKMRPEEIIRLAAALEEHPCDLVERFGLGTDMPVADMRDLARKNGKTLVFADHVA